MHTHGPGDAHFHDDGSYRCDLCDFLKRNHVADEMTEPDYDDEDRDFTPVKH